MTGLNLVRDQWVLRWALGLLSVLAIGLLVVVWFQAEVTKPNYEPFPSITVPPAVRGKMKLFVLAGQSNMSGLGKEPSTFGPHPQIFLFGNDYEWHQAVEPLDNPAGQVDLIAHDSDVGVGPGLAFAHTLLQHNQDAVIGLIPCTRGGSPIDLWRPASGDDMLYGSCLKRVRAALPMGQVAGLIFFQGESDAVVPERNSGLRLSPHDWAEQFAAFVTAWRNDLDMDNLPVVFAQIGSTTDHDLYSNWAVVQAEQASVELPGVMMIKTQDAPLQDYVHYTTGGYELIGRRFAEAYHSLVVSGALRLQNR